MRLPGNKWLGAALLLLLTVSYRAQSESTPEVPASTQKAITSAPMQPTSGSNITDSNTTEPASKDNTTNPIAPTSAVSSTNQSTLAPPTAATAVKPVDNTSSEATTNIPAKTSAKASASTSAATSAVTSSIASQVSPKISGFDLGSFIGGIVLTLGIIAVLFFGCRFYNSRRGVQYRTIDEHEAII